MRSLHEAPSSFTLTHRDRLKSCDLLDHLVGCGEAACLVFAPDLSAVDLHVEDASRTFDQFGFDVELALEVCRQTSGFGVVVSLPTILDADVHISCFLLVCQDARHRPGCQATMYKYAPRAATNLRFLKVSV
jgi:hypothetical protein